MNKRSRTYLFGSSSFFSNMVDIEIDKNNLPLAIEIDTFAYITN